MKPTTSSLPPDRLKVLEKIHTYEQMGGEAFFNDVEDDPPSKPLLPQDVDYLHRTRRFRYNGWICRGIERIFKHILKHYFAIRICGAEQLSKVPGGAIFTSNHFNVTENIAVKLAADQARPKRRLYKLVREGNYFMPGIIGYLLKYCDTMPLSSNVQTMILLEKAIKEILQNGDFILVYPEQSMWWNYTKPRPYRMGAYYYAAKFQVPIVPCFVTLRRKNPKKPDSPSNIGYTIHIMEPIFPDPSRTTRENAREMRERNFTLCREKYEEIYKKPLRYADDDTDADTAKE